MTASNEDSRHNHVIKSVFISVLIDLLGFTVILPLFPSILDHYKGNDQGYLYSSMETAVTSFRNLIGVPQDENINSVLFGGIIGSLFSFLQFLNSPIFGAASDCYGRKPMIFISLVGSALSYTLWGLSSSFAVFLVARVIGGISEANISISTAIIADLPTAKARSRGMAAIGIAFSIGFVFGPVIGAGFASSMAHHRHFYIGPALFSLTITIIDIIYVLSCLPETLPLSKRATSVAASFKDFFHLLNPVSLFRFTAVKSMQGLHKVSRLQRLGLVYFLYLFLFSGLEFTLTFLVHRRFSFSRMEQGKMFGALGIIMTLIQGGYIRRKMAGREKMLALSGMLLLIPGFLLIGFASTRLLLYIGLLFFSCAASSVVPCLSSLTASHGNESEKGRVMGILRSLGALARALGPLCASTSYWLVGASATYAVGSILISAPLLLLSGLTVMSDEKKS